MTATRLRCEYRVDPLGIDVASPRLSWDLVARDPAGHGAGQSAYQVRVARDAAVLRSGGADLWRSGRLASTRSHGIAYAGPPLGPNQACWWTVDLWDEAGRPAPSAPVGCWTMGLSAKDWRAHWISLEDVAVPKALDADWIGYDGTGKGDTEPGHVQYYRRSLILPAAVAPGGAVLLMAAAQDASVFANDVWVGEASGAATATRIELPALDAGPLALAITVGPGRQVRGPTALAATLTVACTDGSHLALRTDASWQCADWAVAAWKQPGFDAVAWPAAALLPQRPAIAAPPPIDGPAIMLRREFTIDRLPLRAVVHMSGLGWSHLLVNGVPASDDLLSPGLTDYARRVIVMSYDVTRLLRPGRNALGVLLGNGRFRAPRPRAKDYGTPRLLLQLMVDDAGGGIVAVASDAAWRATDAGAIRTNNEYDGETVDSRLAMPGWAEPGYDDGAWRQAVLATPPTGTLVANAIEPSRTTAILPPVSVTPGHDGRYLVDFGQNIAGVCRLRVAEAAGTTVVLRHAERLRDGQLDTANLRSAAATDRFIGNGQAQTWQPRFTTHGFRYAEVAGLSHAPDAASIAACVVGDDLRMTGHFACSHPGLTRLHDAIGWSVRANSRSIRTDCPQRDERQGWLGDPAEETRGEAYLFDTAALNAKWMRDVMDAQQPDGSLPDVAPPFWAVDPDDVSWPAAFVAIPGMLAEHFGDQRTLQACLPAMIRWIDHLHGRVQDGAIGNDSYGDWGVPPEDRSLTHAQDPARQTPGPLIATAYLIHCTEAVAGYAEPPVAGRLAAMADRLRAAFHARFFDTGSGWYGSGSATSCILPLAFGLAPPAFVAAVQARLVDRLTEGGGARPAFGLVGAQWVYQVLGTMGRDDLAYAMATRADYPGFGYMLANGATTPWELWNGDTAPPAMSSLNHTMLTGDLLRWLYGHVAGLRPDPAYPGFARSIVQPHVAGDLEWAEAATVTVSGRLACAWRRMGRTLAVSIDVPANTAARFIPPPGSIGDTLDLPSGHHEVSLPWVVG